jgi:glycosyltransferase involved in cell wall biosynthesis
LRIAQLIFGAEFAGAERHAVELANALAARHELLLAHIGRPGGSALEAAIERRLSPAVARIALPRRWPGLALRGMVRRHRLDLVHAHDQRASRYAGRWAGRARKVATVHLGYSPRDHSACDGLICLTTAQRETLGGFRGRVATIDNWVLPHRRLGVEEIERLRRDLGASKETFLIGAVGRLMPIKGFDLLIRAFRAAGLPDARLVIFGEGPLRDELAFQGGSQVLLPGFRDEIKDLYQAFDLFVCSSHSESYSLVVLEAMDAGAPILCTTATGARASLGDASVRWVPPGDPAALEEALRTMYECRPGRYSYPMEQFRPEARVAEIERLYEELLTPPS